MKDKKLEANLSMVASRVMAGLNMNGLKFLLPLWLGALTGVTVRCVFAAVAFWITSWFVKEAPVTRRQRIGLFCLGAFGLYGFKPHGKSYNKWLGEQAKPDGKSGAGHHPPGHALR